MTAPSPSPEESALIARLRAGDPEAFESLVRTNTMALLRAARRFLRSEEDARDAVQEAFISVFRSIGGFQEGARLSTWLHRILVNTCLMRLRTQRRHPEEDLEALLPAFQEDGHQLEPSSAWDLPADALLEQSETATLVRNMIDRLPETYRTVLLLRDIEEMSTEEAAGIIGITPNAVKIRLHRGRQALRSLLDPHMRSLQP